MKIILTGIQAAIFDMDGVITQTAIQHEKAWKKLFDNFLETRKEEFSPFNHNDYLSYVDGKPRYKGVSSFLKSRNIELPYGENTDSPDKETVCGLGNKKNRYFLEVLESEGVKVYQDTIGQIKKWKAIGLKVAVISSSKNCKTILEKAEVLELFDARIDGVVSNELGLKGKPAPDVFIEAAKQLNVSNEKTIIFEDAESGVEAGKAGKFRFVFGVKRKGEKRNLLSRGAHWVIRNLEEVKIANSTADEPTFKEELPSAMSNSETIFKQFANKKPALFFDYDGTLSPIVSKPEDAILSEKMRETIIEVAKNYPVAIVSGRDLRDIQKLVNLDHLIYAGSHGYHIEGPDNLYLENEKAQAILPLLDKLEHELQNDIEQKIEGSKIDRKKFAIAVHYRNVAEKHVEQIKSQVQKIVADHDKLKLGTGKLILEIKPNIDWHKGKAVYWLIEKLNLKKEEVLPVYFGDDVTDEDAFRAIIDDGINILIGEHDEPTAAHYSIKNVDELQSFLSQLNQQP
jgi:trehalose-phosphatase